MNHAGQKNTASRIIDAWPSELQLLLSLASPCSTAGLKTRPDEVKDWDKFLDLVSRHRLAPAINSRLSSTEGIPARIVEKIEESFQRNRMVGLERLRQIVQIHGALAQRGIPSIALKGVLAGMEIHGDPARRHAGDLDILIKPEDFQAADQVLCELGFRPRTLDFPIKKSLLPWVLRQACDKEYVHPDSQTALELHWRLTKNPRLLMIDTKEAFAQARKVPVGTSSVQTLSFEHQLVFLCVHGAKHAWFRLFWLLDVVRLLMNHSSCQTENFFHTQRLSRVLHQTVILARDLFQIALPAELVDHAESDGLAVWLEQRALIEIENPVWRPKSARVSQRLARHYYTLLLRRDFAYRVMHLRQTALSEQDWRELRLPAGCEWLYYAARPVLWLRRRWRNV